MDSALVSRALPLPRVVLKRGHNLGDLWTASNLPPALAQIVLVPVPRGNHKCGACTQHNSTKWSRYLRHPHSGEKIPVSGVVSCATTFVVCLLVRACGKGCVGQTKRRVKQGMAEHRSAAGRKDVTSTAAVHSMGANHSVSSVSARGGELGSMPDSWIKYTLPPLVLKWTMSSGHSFELWLVDHLLNLTFPTECNLVMNVFAACVYYGT